MIRRARQATLWTHHRLQITIPSVLAEGEVFSLRASVIDGEGLPDAAFDRRLRVERAAGIEGLPAVLPPLEEGCLRVDGLRAVGPDRAWVVVRPDGGPDTVHSNPAWVFADPPYRVYWGDLHVHTVYSNCSAWACQDPEFCYAYAREITHLDFAAAADHLRGIAADPGRWLRLQELIRQYRAPGRFVPFLAFESSHRAGRGGDNNAYYLDTDGPMFWLDRADMSGYSPDIPLQDLWRFLDAAGKAYFTVPHHTGRAAKYRSFDDPVYDAAREPLFEIYSGWGSSESRASRLPLWGGNGDRPCYFQDALARGCRYGVIASSDDHRTQPGGEGPMNAAAGSGELLWHVHHGLTAVLAPELTAESLWKALRSRRCYGSTFARSLLDLRVGDLAMGQAGPVDAGDPLRRRRELCVRFLPAHNARYSVTLVRNGRDLECRPWPQDAAELAFEDTAFLDDIAVRDAPFHPAPFVVYYVRLEEPGGQTQWSSPIWLDLKGSGT